MVQRAIAGQFDFNELLSRADFWGAFGGISSARSYLSMICVASGVLLFAFACKNFRTATTKAFLQAKRNCQSFFTCAIVSSGQAATQELFC